MLKTVHKRALSLLLSVVMVLTMLPVTALAATDTKYIDKNGSQQNIGATVIDSGISTLTSGWYVVDSGTMTIDHTVTVSGDVSLILADGASLTVTGSNGDHAGIEVTAGNSLSIYAQSIGSNMGQLTATGSQAGAGIGSADHDSCGTISIYGGRITATGGPGPGNPAGIGDVSGGGMHFGTIGIYGGMITATTRGINQFVPDIGGFGDATDSILIQGGTIVSKRDQGRVVLGVDNVSTMPKIIIDGGSINIGAMTSSGSDPIKNSAGKPVSQSADVLTVPGQANAAVASISIGGVPYGNSVYTDGSGNLYLHPAAYDSIVPVVVTMEDGSRYWSVYQPTAELGGQHIELVNTSENLVNPTESRFMKSNPQDITVYKFDSDHQFSGINNGKSALRKDTDYTVTGDAVTIKADYLKTLPAGVTTLTFAGLGNGNATLAVTVYPEYGYIALGDSIATGYGLEKDDPDYRTLPATAYASIVGKSLNLNIANCAQDGLTSSALLEMLSSSGAQAFLPKAKVVTLSIGSDDILQPFLQIVSDKLCCDDASQIQSKLAGMSSTDLAAVLAALNADDGSSLKNNGYLKDAAARFSSNFNGIIKAIKGAAPNAKIYVTNIYNPYKGFSIPYGADTLNLDEIADGYIQTLNSAFSSNSTDYKLVDVHSAFIGSQQSGTSPVNANLNSFNFDPHPNKDGHALIAKMILAAVGTITPPTPSNPADVSAALSHLFEEKKPTPSETASVVSQVLGLPYASMTQLDSAKIQNLERQMLSALGYSLPTVPAPVTSGFAPSDALPSSPSLVGLTLGAGGAGCTTSLTTTQQPVSSSIPGSLVAFDLTLTRQASGGSKETVHSKLSFPVTVSIQLPPNFVQKANCTYGIVHTKDDGTKENLPVILSGSARSCTATFTTTSFSSFSLVGTDNGSGSDSHSKSSGSSSKTTSINTAPSATFVSDTTSDFSVSGAYQIKITGMNGTVPALVTGTPGVFETQLIRTSGNDYYFKMTAIGKPGDKTGIYVNGTKLLTATVGTAASSVQSDTTSPLKVTKGKTYTFKLTADSMPCFASGNSSVFEVRFLKKSGRDYFYQVTAVGKTGQAAGFYINSSKAPVASATVA